jgi:hypothetical protein
MRLGLAFAGGLVILSACAPSSDASKAEPAGEGATMVNPVVHFEIPVSDMNRAVHFYEAVFGYALRRETVDGYAMAFFPRADGQSGASGALAQGNVYKPAKAGPVLYFDVADIDDTLARAKAQGGSVLYAKKDIGEAGFVAEIEDSEGNRIALSAAKN